MVTIWSDRGSNESCEVYEYMEDSKICKRSVGCVKVDEEWLGVSADKNRTENVVKNF